MSGLRILLVEDNPGDARLVQALLAESHEAVSVERAERLGPALQRLADGGFDLVLLDLGLPDANGLEAVQRMATVAPGLPIVVLSGRDDRDVAIQAVQQGAQDYLLKGRVDGELLLRAARYAIERKRVEAEREQLLASEQEARATAERALRTRDQVLGAISHDLRTPIATISMYAQALEEAGRKGPVAAERVADWASRMGRAAQESLAMIEELLDVARLSMGEEIQLARGPVELSGLVVEAVDQAREAATARAFQLETSPEPLLGRWDRPRLKRVITNLLSNAAKYSPPGPAIQVRVWKEAREGQRWACVAVRDQGIGIPANELPHVFEWYWRASNVGDRRGTGIGLAAARHIVDLHGGRIAVRSTEGEGSEFTVHLPLD